MTTYILSRDDIDGAPIGLLVLVKGGAFSLMISFLSVSLNWLFFLLQQLIKTERNPTRGRREKEVKAGKGREKIIR